MIKEKAIFALPLPQIIQMRTEDTTNLELDRTVILRLFALHVPVEQVPADDIVQVGVNGMVAASRELI